MTTEEETRLKIQLMSILDEKRFKILNYLLENKSGKYLIATQKNISQNTGISLNTVRTFLKHLENKNLIKRHSQGVYELTLPDELGGG